ncbi:MAG: hypothetical protein AABZ11_09215 [Nitrospinota bacterium]|jgi:hypothetical protein
MNDRKTMDKEEPKISCPTFQEQEQVIKDIIVKINRTEGIYEKAIFAEEQQKEVDILLSCPDFDSKRIDCKNCNFIANLRKKTANLIIRTKKLE